jgi:ribonuclease T1
MKWNRTTVKGSTDRGARRIITGDGGEFYWFQDHYESFERNARRNI